MNNELKEWGFKRDIIAFKTALKAEYDDAVKTNNLHIWAQEKEDWVVRGEVLLGEMERLVFDDEVYNVLEPDELRYVWSLVARGAYTVQYMVAVVDGYLDNI